MLVKLSNDVEKYEIGVTKMCQNYSILLQCSIEWHHWSTIRDGNPNVKPPIKDIATQFVAPHAATSMRMTTLGALCKYRGLSFIQRVS